MSDSKLLAERFWSKVDRSAGPYGCWPWRASINTSGYGQIWCVDRHRLVHRMAWELTSGPIPAGSGHHGTCVLHRCDNRRCVNPGHLFLGTNGDNVRDMHAKGRQARKNGEHNGMAKLTEGRVRSMRMIRRLGATYQELAGMFGVSRSTASRACLGITWAHM